MAHYLISYDLRHKRDYKRLFDLLDYWEAKALLDTVFIVSVALTATEVKAALEQMIDGDDALLVVEVASGTDWASIEARQAGVAALRQASA